MITHTLKPNFGVNYDVGYIGFTSRSDDPVAAGIAWFERWDVPDTDDWPHHPSVPDGIVVEHALIVSGPDECIEAHAGTGVQKSTLSKYWNDPHCRIFFRKPRNCSRTLGQDIVISAQRRIGDRYGYGVIVADALANTFLGHCLNAALFNGPNWLISKLLDRKGAEVCSQLAVEVLQENLPHVGILAEPARMVTPQALFEDAVIFEPWKNSEPITTQIA